MRLFALVLAAMLGASISSLDGQQQGGSDSPAWVVERFYSPGPFPEIARHITGEFAAQYRDAPSMGERVPQSVRVTSRALHRDDRRAVYATSLQDSAHAEDWYTYLVRDDGTWKIEAVRSLALPPFFYMLRDSLRATPAPADSLARLLRNMDLVLQPDSALRRYLLRHQAALDSLAELFDRQRDLRIVRSDGSAEPASKLGVTAAIARLLQTLDLNAVMREAEAPQCVFVSVGGILDNAVGFLRARAGCMVPEMTPHEYIYVERVSSHWYLYKTT